MTLAKRPALFLLVTLLAAATGASAQNKVDISGIRASVKMEETVYGHLAELNGKFKFRVTELTFEPGGMLGAHHHAGPGVRYVVSGEITFRQAGKDTLYKAGDYFFESGDIVHTAQNKTKTSVRVIFFEVLPVQWSGSAVIPPKAN